ncbi:MAG: Ig-like domain-containing protein [Chitinivibrionales bacterium]|nr:Ig-like domain-containing protein [Chitinivibrionales bacterium]
MKPNGKRVTSRPEQCRPVDDSKSLIMHYCRKKVPWQLNDLKWRTSGAVMAAGVFCLLQARTYVPQSLASFTDSAVSTSFYATVDTICAGVERTEFAILLTATEFTPPGDQADQVKVVAQFDNTFSFLTASHSGSVCRLIRSDYRASSSSVDSLSYDIVLNESSDPISYLNSIKGGQAGRGMTLFSQIIASNPSVLAATMNCNDQCILKKTTLNNSNLRSNHVCYYKNNNSIYVYKKDNSRMVIGTVGYTVSGPVFDVSSTAEITSSIINNPSVAVDSVNNRVCLVFTKGNAFGYKTLDYKILGTDYTELGAATISTGVSKNGEIMKYNDATVACFAPYRFIVIYRTEDGIVIDTVNATPSLPSYVCAQFLKINGSNLWAPTLALSSSRIVVAWKDFTAQTVKSFLLPIENDAISSSNRTADKVIVSGVAGIDSSDSKEAISCDINASRTAGYLWITNNKAYGSIWKDRDVHYLSGQWCSKDTESIALDQDDEMRYDTVIVNTEANGGTVRAFLQVSDNPATFSQKEWLSVDLTKDSLRRRTVGQNKFFRCSLALGRGADQYSTPLVRSMAIRSDARPVLKSFDSVRVNVTKKNNVQFDSTLDIVSRDADGTDYVDFFVSVRDADGNDRDSLWIDWPVISSLSDTILQNSVAMKGKVRLYADTTPESTRSCTFYVRDSSGWQSESESVTIRSRSRRPIIDTVTFNGELISSGGKAIMRLGLSNTVSVGLVQTTIASWNPVRVRYVLEKKTGADTTVKSGVSPFVFTAQSQDTALTMTAIDAFDSSYTHRILLRYPQFKHDSIAYSGSKQILSDTVPFILGAVVSDSTIVLPIINTGNDFLIVDSLYFRGSSLRWLSVGVPKQGGTVEFFDSLNQTHGMQSFSVSAGTTDTIRCLLNTRLLLGDGIVADSIIIVTNDPLKRRDTIGIFLRYNTLPFIDSVVYDFDPTRPYWLQSRQRQERLSGYRFPPHAGLRVFFSEQMDTTSVRDSVLTCYSIFDSLQRATIDTITLLRGWNSNNTQLVLRPHYRRASSFFSGIKPPDGFFIPTDSLSLHILPALKDMAGNGLDVDRDFIRDTTDYYQKRMRVDSIRFTITGIQPAPGSSNVAGNQPIVLTFSDPIYPGTIDTSNNNNQSLRLISSYLLSSDTASVISFSAVSINGATVTFVPAKQFFFGDRIRCSYRPVSGRDSAGYPIDWDKDGIPSHLFDSASTRDSVLWSFNVRDVSLVSPYPRPFSDTSSLEPEIQLVFSTGLPPGVIDLNTRGNQSLTVTSTYSHGSRIDFTSVAIDDNVARFRLNRRLFYDDSVNCLFGGLISRDTAAFAIPVNADSLFRDNRGAQWHFWVRDLSICSVFPVAGATNADVKTPIEMHFPGPVSPWMIDTTSNCQANRSFYFTTSYSAGARMPISRILFSADSTAVYVYPKQAFFDYDSVGCVFRGYRKGYSYSSGGSVIADSSTEGNNAYHWYFLTGSAGFYTFPNPYKPGSDYQHRSLGGIWFKNLHSIAGRRGAVTDVRVRVYTITTQLVYESPLIHFEEGNAEKKPLWFWDTRNNRSTLCATGVYLYAIFDKSNKAYIKGKLLIVR